MTMQPGTSSMLSEPEYYQLLSVCASLIELYASESITIWKFYSTNRDQSDGLVTLIGGLNLDGTQITTSPQYQSIPITEFPSIVSSMDLGGSIGPGLSSLGSLAEARFKLEAGLQSLEAEPVRANGMTVGFILISPPRLFDTDRSAILPAIVAPLRKLLSQELVPDIRNDTYYLASLAAQCIRTGSLQQSLQTIAKSVSNRMHSKGGSIWLVDSWRDLFDSSTSHMLKDIRHRFIINEVLDELSYNRIRPAVLYSSVQSHSSTELIDLTCDDSGNISCLEKFLNSQVPVLVESKLPLEPAVWVEIVGISVTCYSVTVGVIAFELGGTGSFGPADYYLLSEVSHLIDLLMRYFSSAQGLSMALQPETSVSWATIENIDQSDLGLQRIERNICDVLQCSSVEVLPNDSTVGTGPYALSCVVDSFRSRTVHVTKDMWATEGFSDNSGELVRDADGNSRFIYSNPQIQSGPKPIMRGCVAVPIFSRSDTNFVILAGNPTKPLELNSYQIDYLDFVSADGSLANFILDLRRRSSISDKLLASDLIYDPIAGLSNTVLFYDRLEHSMRHAEREQSPIAMLLIDIVNFSDINFTMGYRSGNVILKELADRLKTTLRDCDYLSRVSEDTFAVVMTTGVSDVGLDKVVTRLKDVLGLPFYVDNQAILLSFYLAPFGWLGGPVDSTEFFNMSYREFQATKLSVMDSESVKRLSDQEDQFVPLQLAISHEDILQGFSNGQFILEYLPQIALANKDVSTFEALIRWNHPRFGKLSPGQFLHYIQGSELEWELTRWVIETAADQCLEWYLGGLTTSVSINLTSNDILNYPLAETVERVIEMTHLAPRQIVLEMSEETVRDPAIRSSGSLNILRTLGVRVSIDNCGSGRVAPLYLAKMPVDQIKLDNSLLTLDDPKDIDLVQKIVQLGHEFGVLIVAEAIEENQRMDKMIELGVDELQGFRISEPLPTETVIEWTQNYRKRAGIPTSIDWRG